MKWRAYRAEICFQSALSLNIRSSCAPCCYKLGLLIFAKEKNCSGRVAVESKIKRDAVDFVNSSG